MRTALAIAIALIVATPALHAQETSEILAGLRSGGGWVSIPIRHGVGTYRTSTLPTVGMTLTGCLNVWGGHSGEFEIRAHDQVSDSTLVVTAVPGVGVPFSHTFGRSAQIDVAVRWSEPRDTTLVLWVGLAMGRSVQEACRPVYGRAR